MLAIVLDFWSPHDERIPGAYNAVMNGLVGMWRASEAIEYGTKAIDYGSREPDERLNYNPDRYLRNRAHAYIYTGEFENARKDLTEASYWQVLKHGPNSHFDGEYVSSSLYVCILYFGLIPRHQKRPALQQS
jgi:hypothetical protein